MGPLPVPWHSVYTIGINTKLHTGFILKSYNEPNQRRDGLGKEEIWIN